MKLKELVNVCNCSIHVFDFSREMACILNYDLYFKRYYDLSSLNKYGECQVLFVKIRSNYITYYLYVVIDI